MLFFGRRAITKALWLAAVKPEPELEAAMRRVEQLSARKQVRKFIGVISGKCVINLYSVEYEWALKLRPTIMLAHAWKNIILH
ncbi:hypothetical protein FML25_26950 [Klebsiella oxytoca]|nr:hypothetical protein [Klebsiella oxytoca]MBZ7308923.1 hypothetical protein [Klebsiella oxytoca]MBZ7691584.1 hypothetical protein [Klebsiella oxytoca]MBZ7762837.1 hypothetical protein [Klebsiella oxytoca]TGN44210.1 hypothetical protein E5Q62_13935 [Klebsiella oxytoca]